MIELGTEFIYMPKGHNLREKHIIEERVKVQDNGEEKFLYKTNHWEVYITEEEIKKDFLPVLQTENIHQKTI